jgi:hypothetical protein
LSGTARTDSKIKVQSADYTGMRISGTPMVAVGGGTVWVAEAMDPVVYRFDGLAAKPTSQSLADRGGTRAMAATATDLWLLREDSSLTRIDATTKKQETIAVTASATGLAIGPASLWLLDEGTRTVRSVDPGSGQTIATIEVGGIPANAVFADGALWVMIHAP